ncbi:MAG: ribbon-helix-helix domain-containing protein [Paludibacteraceae bacterium]|nr:ribbon-helix-helix domain-containing protein [Paludibacteraceae bacterium]
MARQKKEKCNNAPSKRDRLVRDKRMSITLNEKELRVIERFFKEYKIKNKSKFLRDTIIHTVWEKLEESAPTLFSKDEMR